MMTTNSLIDPHPDQCVCATRYPVILVSGMGFTEHNRLLDYWGKIPHDLSQKGCHVYTARTQAFSSHVDNAIKLKERILEILDKSAEDKINIIGHSKGGLEARYMISQLDMENKVASLTTLGSPHRGSGLAEIIVGKTPVGRVAASRLVNIYARLLGDKNPDSLRAGFQVSRKSMEQFNADVPDSAKVYYQSWAGHVGKDYPNTLWKTMAGIIMRTDGKNDGLVSIESAKWGHYRGIIQTEQAPYVSHADMVGLTQFSGYHGFNARSYLADIVIELKEMGY